MGSLKLIQKDEQGLLLTDLVIFFYLLFLSVCLLLAIYSFIVIYYI